MPRRVAKRAIRRTFLRQWREFRNLTLEKAADRFHMSAAQLSRLERGESDITLGFLEAAANAYLTDVPSLLMRDPTDPEAIWSLWDIAKPGERRQIEDLARVVVRRRA